MKKLYLFYLLCVLTSIIMAQPANDDCASAEVITVTTTTSTVNFEIGGADINNETGCDGNTNNYADIWYEFIMPVNGNLFIDAFVAWNNIALYDACGGNEVQCGFDNQFITDLTAGTTYKLRIFRTIGNADNNSFRNFSIKAFEQVSNDDCTSAEVITVTTTTSTVNFEIGGADINNETGCDGNTNNYADIWYEFIMPVNGNLFIDAFVAWNNIALYDACGGNEVQCGFDNQFITDLTAGTTYKLRIFRTISNADNNSFRNFSIKAFEQVSNDDCTSAEVITVTTTTSTVNFEIGGADINNETGCDGNTNNYADIWYEFIMPVNGNLFIDAFVAWNNIALYDACGGNEVQCGFDNQFITDLTAGTTYKLRIFRTIGNADNNSFRNFSIKAFEQVSNDDCTSAEVITVTTTTSTVNFEIGGADINNETGCDGNTNNYADIWYEFIMPVNGNLFIDAFVAWNNIALYDACGGNEVQCGFDNQFITDLTAGTTYKLRIFRTISNADNNSFRNFSVNVEETLGIDSATLDSLVSIYPNPTINNITIQTNASVKNIELYTILGELVFETTETQNISTSQLSKGIYLIKIKTEKGELIKKIIKN